MWMCNCGHLDMLLMPLLLLLLILLLSNLGGLTVDNSRTTVDVVVVVGVII